MNRVSRKSGGRRKRRSLGRRSKVSRRRSRVSQRRSRCNSRRLKRSCKRGKRCSWVKRKSSGRRKHKGYCKKGGAARDPPLSVPDHKTKIGEYREMLRGMNGLLTYNGDPLDPADPQENIASQIFQKNANVFQELLDKNRLWNYNDLERCWPEEQDKERLREIISENLTHYAKKLDRDKERIEARELLLGT